MQEIQVLRLGNIVPDFEADTTHGEEERIHLHLPANQTASCFWLAASTLVLAKLNLHMLVTQDQSNGMSG